MYYHHPMVFLTSLPLAIHFTICYHAYGMTAYTIPHIQTISQEVAARKKIIERAHNFERESYKAMMQKRGQWQTQSDLASHEALNQQS